MREEYFAVLSTLNYDEIPEFLAQYGRDLKDWTHTSASAGHNHAPVWHYVVARFGSEYGDIEDDMYVPFDSDINVRYDVVTSKPQRMDTGYP